MGWVRALGRGPCQMYSIAIQTQYMYSTYTVHLMETNVQYTVWILYSIYTVYNVLYICTGQYCTYVAYQLGPGARFLRLRWKTRALLPSVEGPHRLGQGRRRCWSTSNRALLCSAKSAEKVNL